MGRRWDPSVAKEKATCRAEALGWDVGTGEDALAEAERLRLTVTDWRSPPFGRMTPAFLSGGLLILEPPVGTRAVGPHLAKGGPAFD